MTIKYVLRVSLLVSLLIGAGTAFAHHSPARFQENQFVSVFGTVTRFDWRNPHVYLSVEDSDGVEWLFETNATSNLLRLGWRRDAFKPGDQVTVRAHANIDPDKTHAMLVSAIDAGGKAYSGRVVDTNTEQSLAAATATDLNGVWRGDPGLAFAFLFGMIDHPVTEKAAVARARYNESMDPVANCVTWPTPRLVAWSAFYLVELEITENAIYFRSEFDRLERIIHTDGRPHPEGGERTSQGHSIGWWEDDTLVVDTVLFADSISPVADGIPSGAQKHVIEKYTLDDDGATAKVAVWMEDPEYLAEPYAAELVWHYSPHLEMLEFDCDPDVSKRFVQ